MAEKSDILVLGATGFTGRLITRYLSAHPQRQQFSLALGARSQARLKTLNDELSLPSAVKLVQIDVTDDADVERAVSGARVVINTIGPYWTWGTPVVRQCVRLGVHYVDLTGEPFWIKQIIREFDYCATKTGSIIVPGCGFDSLPSDLAPFLANKTFKSLPPVNGEYLEISDSTTAIHTKGGVSGGTINSFMTALDAVPQRILEEASEPYSLSPIQGRRRNMYQLLYKLPIPGSKTLLGAFFLMAPSNTAVIQRTFGLLELQERNAAASSVSSPSRDTELQTARKLRYGPQFSYLEFMVVRSRMTAIIVTTILLAGFVMLLVKPIRHFVRKFLPQSGEGPSDDEMQKGWLKCTNISVSSSSPKVEVQTVIKGRGDPGYLLTAIMISECALSMLLPFASEAKKAVVTRGLSSNISSLPALAKTGGILTPSTAFGDVLVRRLEETGRFDFTSTFVNDVNATRKRV